MNRGNPYGGNIPPMHHDGRPPMQGGIPPGGQGPPPGQVPGAMPPPGEPAQQNSNSRTVFVGNIPYDADDSQIKALLALVGPFVTFRLKHDKETEKPKGFGF